jgi:hypothetical protein
MKEGVVLESTFLTFCFGGTKPAVVFRRETVITQLQYCAGIMHTCALQCLELYASDQPMYSFPTFEETKWTVLCRSKNLRIPVCFIFVILSVCKAC